MRARRFAIVETTDYLRDEGGRASARRRRCSTRRARRTRRARPGHARSALRAEGITCGSRSSGSTSDEHASPRADARGSEALRREGLPRHLDRRHRRGARRPEGLALLAHRLEGGPALRDDARGRGRLPRRARRDPGRPAPVEKIRLALRGHLRVVAEQLDVATVFVQEWRYLEGARRDEIVAERRRYEERIRELLREGRELGELRADLDDGCGGAAAAVGGELGLHVAPGPAATPTRSPTASSRCSSTGCAATRRRRNRTRSFPSVRASAPRYPRLHAGEPDRQSLRDQRDRGARALVEERLGAVETLLTERRGPRDRARGRAAGDAVFVLGGDGVVNEVVNGLPAGQAARGSFAGGHTNVFARALGAPRGSCGGDPRAADLARARQRPAVRIRRRDRRRLGGGARAGHGQARRDGRRRGDLAYARVVARRLLAGYEQRLEVEGLGRAALVFVSNDSVYSYAGRWPCASRLRRGSSSGSMSVRPGARRPAECDAPCRPARGRPRARRAPGVHTLHDADRRASFAATSRCRSRRTARTSATSPRPFSRPSATRSPCSV